MMNIFLDLEGTVIDEFKEFPTFLPSQVEDIKRFLAPMKLVQPQRLFIFSFAIDTNDEEATFDTFARPLLSRIGMMGVPGTLEVIRVWKMLEASKKVNQVSVLDRHDFIMLIGKERAFHDWTNLNHPGEFSFLIDDVVHNRTTHDNDNGTIIQTLNVRDLLRLPKNINIPL